MSWTSAFAPVLPEIWLAAAAMALLLLGVFQKEDPFARISRLAVGALAVTFVLVVGRDDGRVAAFDGLFVVDEFARFMKGLVLIGSALAIVLAEDWLVKERAQRFEYPVLVLLATVGMMAMISANDLVSLYVGLELQSMALYVLAAFQRDAVRSTEAGLKYFVLGALASGMLLYGASLLYGFTGTTGFEPMAARLREANQLPLGALIGMAFLIAGLAFKVSAVPFHMWTPDVYEGAPTPVTAFFAFTPKIAAMALFMRTMMTPFGDIGPAWQQILVVLSIASMGLGAYAAIGQDNIKRLMAYSSIGHVGYALVGLTAGTGEGLRGVAIYLAIYLAMNAGAFAIILGMRRRGQAVEEIPELAGLAKTEPLTAAGLAVLLFSLAGVPPMAGFFGKFYVFMAAVNAGLFVLAVLGVLASVVGAFYYLRIVKLMYFDPPAEPFERPMPGAVGAVAAASALFTLLFFAWPAPLVAGAEAAAQALLRLP
ncbi:MAG: NADH-quinone oxidoreductase subunit NuoN [Alphaproteobacteria bacterium]|nr:NADH-quinone oxidoreductase subunit NuoN [Alphaproteobacteria bacterium]